MPRMNALKPLIAMIAASATLLAANAPSISSIPLKNIDGKDTTLAAYKGKVVLVVNVASKCGLTPQYKALESTFRKYKDKGFVIVGFPCNDFGAQEPGSPEEIKTFCSTKYDVSFPLMAKLHVKGSEQHPLYAALTGPDAKFPGDIEWNFGKFLVGRDGKAIRRYPPQTGPDDKGLLQDIADALAP